ncbi:tetratricopeptide repeat protein [bacterium]|nr:tetratricopeptide repeat protein [bacterium]
MLARFGNLPPGEAFVAAVDAAIVARDREREAIRLEREQDSFGAARVYRDAIDLNPHDRSLRRGFATMRSAQGVRYARREEYTAAYGYMLEAVRTDSTYVNGFANLGRLLSEMKNYDYALSTLRQAAALAPEDDLVRFEIGRAWRRRGYVDKAIPFYEQALELNPQNVQAVVELVDSRIIMQGDHPDFRAALDLLERARKVAPDDEDVLERIRRFEGTLRGDDPHAGHDHGPVPVPGTEAPSAEPLHDDADGHDHGHADDTGSSADSG